MDIRIDGLDDVRRHLQKLRDNAKALNGRHDVSLQDLFSPDFMMVYTSFQDVDAFLTASGLVNEGYTQEDFDNIPANRLDTWVAQETKFATWKDMKDQAVTEWSERRLKDGIE